LKHPDILVLSESSLPDEGKVVLALVEGVVAIKRWALEGRKVIFSSLDTDNEPLKVPRRNVEFIGEVTGVLRFISLNPEPENRFHQRQWPQDVCAERSWSTDSTPERI
jgi:hypothetical protein